MFSIALSLALPPISRAVPAASVTSGAAIAVCFSPEEDCAAFAVRAINNAEREILVGAYGLTTSSGIVEALVRAKGRGVDVRLIADKTPPARATNGIGPRAAAGMPIWIDAQARTAHAKKMVIDDAVTLTDSYNWTRGAAANSENLNLVSSSLCRVAAELAERPFDPGPDLAHHQLHRAHRRLMRGRTDFEREAHVHRM